MNHADFHNRFNSLRHEYHATKKVGVFFSAMFDLANSVDSRALHNMVVGEYNHLAAALPADKFAACATKYGFPVRMERA